MPSRTKGSARRSLALLLFSACGYDPNDRCGPGEVLSDEDWCVCAENHVPILRDIKVIVASNPLAPKLRSGCRACGENSVATGYECACIEGYELGELGCEPKPPEPPEPICAENELAMDGVCVETNLGNACAMNADCVGTATMCKLPEGYCTASTCASNADCWSGGGYQCRTGASAPFCMRAPGGQGTACTIQGIDPVCDSDASICALGSCHVSGCATTDDCSADRTCCDLSALSGQPGFTLCMSGGCP